MRIETPDRTGLPLRELFQELNSLHFDGMLDAPELRWNRRMQTSAGRFAPRRGAPIIEIASYLLEEAGALGHLRDTLGHEMIHYWLWVRRRPYGHTDEFYAKMRLMGVSRYNSVPRRRPIRHLYACPSCGREFPARRRLGRLACLDCCERWNGGEYDARFMLIRVIRDSVPAG